MATNRTLKNSKANKAAIDIDDAWNRATARGQDIVQDALDPQAGPVENRKRAASRKVPGF